ncbi:hypothetical protein KFL_005670010, partial [Klebsormidium nitens]
MAAPASRQVILVVALFLVCCMSEVVCAQPSLQRMTFWTKGNASYGLSRHVPVWFADKLRNGDTDTFNDDLFDADQSDLTRGSKIGYQAGTCVLTSTPGDGSDR